MKNVMSRAWTIARQGQSKFGGQIKEYFAAALKMAWKEVKKMNSLMEEAKQKGLNKYNDYIQNILKNGGKLVAQYGDKYIIENMGKKHTVTFSMSDLTVFVKVTAGKRIEHFNLGSVA